MKRNILLSLLLTIWMQSNFAINSSDIESTIAQIMTEDKIDKIIDDDSFAYLTVMEQNFEKNEYLFFYNDYLAFITVNNNPSLSQKILRDMKSVLKQYNRIRDIIKLRESIYLVSFSDKKMGEFTLVLKEESGQLLIDIKYFIKVMNTLIYIEKLYQGIR